MYFDFIPCRMAGTPAMIPDRAGPSLRRQSRRTYFVSARQSGGFVRLSFASPCIQCAGRRRIFKQQLRNHRLLQQTLNVFEKGATMHRGVYTDFLCKALPMPTEGPSDISEAAALLSELHGQNICRMIFAPLFYPRCSLGDGSLGVFIRTRNRIFKELKPYLPHGRYAILFLPRSVCSPDASRTPI